MIKGRAHLLLFVVFALVVCGFPDARCSAADAPPSEGDILPEIVLPLPQDAAERQYLGINDRNLFSIPQIQAEIVVLEAFSMYCPFCQNEAPAVNELYKTIADRPDLKDRIKLLGIGVGNTAFEVNVFRKKYNIAFPLFPDPAFSIYDKLGNVRTPYFVAVKIGPNGTHKVIYSKVGTIGNPSEFVDLLLKRSEK
jgi:peroxiredoxin